MDFGKQVETVFQKLLAPTLADGGGAILEGIDIERGSIVVRLVGSCLLCPSIKLSAINFIQGFTSSRICDLRSVKIVAGDYTIAEWKGNDLVHTSILSDVIANRPSLVKHEQTSLSELKNKFRIFNKQ